MAVRSQMILTLPVVDTDGPLLVMLVLLLLRSEVREAFFEFEPFLRSWSLSKMRLVAHRTCSEDIIRCVDALVKGTATTSAPLLLSLSLRERNMVNLRIIALPLDVPRPAASKSARY